MGPYGLWLRWLHGAGRSGSRRSFEGLWMRGGRNPKFGNFQNRMGGCLRSCLGITGVTKKWCLWRSGYAQVAQEWPAQSISASPQPFRSPSIPNCCKSWLPRCYISCCESKLYWSPGLLCFPVYAVWLSWPHPLGHQESQLHAACPLVIKHCKKFAGLVRWWSHSNLHLE